MANLRRNTVSRPIRGPHSALTDFLASQGISAAQIREEHDARVRAAADTASANDATNAATGGVEGEGGGDDDDDDEITPASARRNAQNRKRKRQAEAIDKIKKAKAKAGKKRKPGKDDDDDVSDEEDLVEALFKANATPKFGQMCNCEICDKRFTVTPYSRAGPNSGLLCPKCSRELAKDEDANKKKAKKAAAGPRAVGGRRKHQSRMLDGQTGTKSLLTLCIETLAKNIELAEDIGDLPSHVIDKISRMLSKRRLLTPNNLLLFLKGQPDEIKVYDAALLSSDDYVRIFQTLPDLKRIKLRNAIQFKDEVMEFLVGRHIELESIYLHGSNLLSEDHWNQYLKAKGQHLKGLQVYFTDKHFTDDILGNLKDYCPSLDRLKVCHNQQVSDEGIKRIADIGTLEHLSLKVTKQTSTEPYVHVLEKIGKNLQTFSLRDVEDVDDRLLDALHEHCRSLTKLRITDSNVMTDSAFIRLFKDWENPPLRIVDFEKCRHVDAEHPRDNAHMVGLCSGGFKALMQHSAKQLRRLNIHACRYISADAFEEVFSPDKVYPELQFLEISFCEEVNDFIVGSIFRSCPKLKELNVFGCMKVKDVRVPKGKILVGVPTAMGMQIEGDD